MEIGYTTEQEALRTELRGYYDGLLDEDGRIDESFVVAESYRTLLVFPASNDWPRDAVAPNSRLP